MMGLKGGWGKVSFPNRFPPNREKLVWWILMAYSIFIHCGWKNWDIIFVRRQHCLPRRFRITEERRSWKEKLLSVTERLWSKLTGILTFHCQLSSSQIHPRHSWNCWQPSCDWVSVLHSLVFCILPRLLSFLGHHYSRTLRHLCNATWLARQHSGVWNKNGIGHSLDHFPVCGEKWSGNETRRRLGEGPNF